jgi:uncharacterized protein YehS (DUF1456 family)
MTKNDILIRLRYALNITDLALVDIFALGGKPMKVEAIRPLFLKKEDPGYRECDGSTLGSFLQGLIVSRRGPREEQTNQRPQPTGGRKLPSAPPSWQNNPSNNDVLKALRIALQLKDVDVVDTMRAAGADVTVSELNTLFRKEGHSKYQACGDQFLRNFLNGITKKYRI